MSTKPTTPTVIDHAGENERMRKVLHELDSMGQENAERIESLCLAAQALLRPEADALISVDKILRMIYEIANETMDNINGEAEKFGVNFVDSLGRERHDAIHQACKLRSPGATAPEREGGPQ